MLHIGVFSADDFTCCKKHIQSCTQFMWTVNQLYSVKMWYMSIKHSNTDTKWSIQVKGTRIMYVKGENRKQNSNKSTNTSTKFWQSPPKPNQTKPQRKNTTKSATKNNGIWKHQSYKKKQLLTRNTDLAHPSVSGGKLGKDNGALHPPTPCRVCVHVPLRKNRVSEQASERQRENFSLPAVSPMDTKKIQYYAFFNAFF